MIEGLNGLDIVLMLIGVFVILMASIFGIMIYMTDLKDDALPKLQDENELL